MFNHTPTPMQSYGTHICYRPKGLDLTDVAIVPNKEHREFIVTACNSHEELVALLQDAKDRLEGFIGSDCECDNTHTNNKTVCCLCEYKEALRKAGAL